jgi:hypothetical protein
VAFSETVNVTGTPRLTLETGVNDRTIDYSSGSGTNTLTFSYTVQAGDTSADLDYVATNSLVLNGGTIRDASGNDATLTLASPGASGSLRANKALVIDGIAPTVVSVSSTTADGSYRAGSLIDIRVNFSETIVVTGTPRITLETGSTDRTLNFFSYGDDDRTIRFNYLVLEGDVSSDLDYVATTSLVLNGGTITDEVGNNATLTLPAPGTAGSLGANEAIIIDTAAPTRSSQTVASNGTSLALAFNETLSATTSATTSFTVTRGGSENVTVSSVSVSGSTVTISLGSTIFVGETLTVSYTDPSGSDDPNAIQDLAGNDAASFTNVSVTNGSTQQRSQSITFGALSPRTLGTGTVALSATATSGLSVSFASSNNSICSVSGTTLTLVAAGTCSITASQSGNITWSAASSVPRSFTISETLTITTPSSGLSGTYGTSFSLTLSASGGSGNNAFTLFSGSLPSGLSLSSAGTISGTPTAAGSSAITVRVTDSNTATATTGSFTITIAQRPITIKAADRSATYTGSAVSVSNTYSITSGTLAGSDSITSLTYTYTRSLPSYDSTTAPTTAGTYTITPSAASFSPGSASNYALTYETATLTIGVASQTITFTAPTTKVFGSGSFTLPLTDTTTSGLAITFASTTPSTCTLSGPDSRTVTLVAAGTCTLTADQEGDSNYTAASQVTRSFTISKATTSLSSFTISSKTFGNAPFTLTAPTVTGSLAGTFTYSSSNTLIATISDSAVTIVKAGSVTITALFTPTDSANYETSTITATLTIDKAGQASITITTTTVAFGQTLSLLTSGGSGTGSLSFTPSGDCTISGSTLTPTQVGSCTVTATKASDDNYLAETSSVTTITITTGSATATISFTSATFTFGITNPITVTTSVAGVVRFSANGKLIKNCKARSTTLTGPFTATCSYRPDTRRPLTITATLTPTDTRFAARTSTSGTFLVGRRTGGR